MIDVKVQLVPGGRMPVRGSEGAAAFDLFARIETLPGYPAHTAFMRLSSARVEDNGGIHYGEHQESWAYQAAPVVMIPLGVKFSIPKGYVGKLYSRSSLGKRGLVLPNGVGVIDSDYRGEICMMLMNASGEDIIVGNGERIAQIIIEPIPDVTFVQVDALDETVRGEGGLGSTGR